MMADWQIAPPEYDINTYDAPKFQYRRHVEDFIATIPAKSLKKKSFVTISTNVLCAETDSKHPSLDPRDRDIYQPLEIALTKWSVAEAGKAKAERTFNTLTWILNPGPPKGPGTILYAKDHFEKAPVKHKIDYKDFSDKTPYIEKDLQKVVKEINAFLTIDRIVFSNTLKHCRQDLGCLKWLNRETGYKLKPIKVYSVEDLYVVLLRQFRPDGYPKDSICQGVARFRYESSINAYESNDQCHYHRDRLMEDPDAECGCCAKLIATEWGHVILDDIDSLLLVARQINNPGDGADLANSMANLDLGPGNDKH